MDSSVGTSCDAGEQGMDVVIQTQKLLHARMQIALTKEKDSLQISKLQICVRQTALLKALTCYGNNSCVVMQSRTLSV